MSQRIVVVDDSRTVCGVVEWAYHGSGIEVLPCLTGAEALAAIRKSPPIAVVVDYALPDMGSAAFVAALRAEVGAAKVPILLLTGGYHSVDTAGILAAGADDELRKPFKAAELLSKVQTVRDRGAARGYFGGARPAAPPPLKSAGPPPLSPQPLVAPPPAVAPPIAAAPLIAPPPLVAAPPIAPPPRPIGLVAPPPSPPPQHPAASPAFSTPGSTPNQQAFSSPGLYGPANSPSSGAHRVTAPPPPSGLRTEEREALLRALQPVVLEQVKGALPGIVREVLPAMLREVLGAVMREQLGAKVEEYSRRRVDEYVERELPGAADAAIERYLTRISASGEEQS